jgi:hypothetical protein
MIYEHFKGSDIDRDKLFTLVHCGEVIIVRNFDNSKSMDLAGKHSHSPFDSCNFQILISD